jgi:hypothetical protein
VKAGQVQQVVDHWRLLRPRTGPEFGEPGSKSFAVIEKALVLMASDPAGAVTACCEAIDGLHMAPWMSYGKRYATPGEGRVLRRDLEHALGDEQRIQKCRQILRWMRAGGAERAWEIYQAVQETEQVLRAEVMDLLGEQRFRREEPADWSRFSSRWKGCGRGCLRRPRRRRERTESRHEHGAERSRSPLNVRCWHSIVSGTPGTTTRRPNTFRVRIAAGRASR